MPNKLIYSFSRFIYLLSKPVLIYLLTALNKPLANDITTIFIVVSLVMSFVQMDGHRQFYMQYFSKNEYKEFSFSLKNYLILLFFILLLGSFCSFILTYFRINNLAISLFICLFFMSEKIFDEVLRFCLFEERVRRWALITLVRTASYIIAGFSIVFYGGVTGIVLFLGIYSTISILFLLFIINKYYFNKKILWLRKPSLQFRIVFRNIKQLHLFWFASISVIVLSYSDRLIAYVFEIHDIADFFIIITITSCIPLFIDFFYVSYRRQSFLLGKYNNLSFFYERSFIFIILLGLIITVVAFYILKLRGGNVYIKDILLIITLIYTQLIVSISSIVRDIFYWHKQQQTLLAIELTTIFLITIGISILAFFWGEQLQIGIIFLLFSLLLTLRLLLFITVLLAGKEIINLIYFTIDSISKLK